MGRGCLRRTHRAVRTLNYLPCPPARIELAACLMGRLWLICGDDDIWEHSVHQGRPPQSPDSSWARAVLPLPAVTRPSTIPQGRPIPHSSSISSPSSRSACCSRRSCDRNCGVDTRLHRSVRIHKPACGICSSRCKIQRRNCRIRGSLFCNR